jgi:hypothetical protein
MQEQRPLGFALIVQRTTNPCQCVLLCPRYHNKFLRENLTTFLATMFSRKEYIWTVRFTRAETESIQLYIQCKI